MDKWDKIYKEECMTLWEPQQSIVQFTARFIKRRIGYNKYEIKREASKILELGCGNGSAVHFFAKQGFDVYGIDISKIAIGIARNYLKKENLKANFEVCSCDNLPYEEDFFDFITCYGILDHVKMGIARKTIEEVKRVLKPNSLFFVTLCSTKASAFGKGEKADKNTYILEEGHEKGEIQHYFDLEEIQELLRDFKIIDLRHSREDVYDDKLDIESNSARWFITCELEK